MPGRLKHLFCRHCGSYLPPEKVRVRLRQGVLTATCLSCGEQMRQPYRSIKAEQERPGPRERRGR
jgi:ribonuclease P protein subunit RPR2